MKPDATLGDIKRVSRMRTPPEFIGPGRATTRSSASAASNYPRSASASIARAS
jgi:hypothetical protein